MLRGLRIRCGSKKGGSRGLMRMRRAAGVHALLNAFYVCPMHANWHNADALQRSFLVSQFFLRYPVVLLDAGIEWL